jgi:hypothetical protein
MFIFIIALPVWIIAGNLGNLDFPRTNGTCRGSEGEGKGGGVGRDVADVDVNYDEYVCSV